MKLIIAIVRDNDNDPVSRALTAQGFRVTLVASTGGFLRRGSTTLLIGVEDAQVEQGMNLIRDNLAPPSEPGAHRATIFVLPVEHFTRV
ncbi:MAG: cyclic-di-AMP receptor [Anaerolineaceae bacterium]|nr:cyclic-di-AMP receptor [Anaerolineaceae bacterium]